MNATTDLTHSARTVLELATGVAAELTATSAYDWTVETYSGVYGVYLTAVEANAPKVAARIFARPEQGSGTRVEFTTTYDSAPGVTLNTYLDPSLTPGSMTAALGRPAARIAGEVLRKLVPNALHVWAAYEAAKAQTTVEEQAQTRMGTRLANLIGGSYVKPSRVSGHGRVHLPNTFGGYGHAEVNYNGSRVALDISGLTPGQAEAMLAALAAYGEQE